MSARCERCSEVVSHCNGGVWVPYADIRRHADLLQEWHRRYPGHEHGCSLTDLLAYPDPIHWRVTHWSCRAPDEIDAYWIELPRSHAEWLMRAAHLMGKTWVADSDLDDLLREVAQHERRFAA